MSFRLDMAGSVARLLIDRAAKRNAVDQAMWESLPGLLDRAQADAATRVIVLQSAEPGLFCAGADIAEMLAKAPDPHWRAANQAALNRAQFLLARVDTPVIAYIDGDCVGAGCGLALACDLRIATPRARFGITPAKLGLVYPLHDTKLLVDAIGPAQAKRLLFTAGLLDAAEAHRIGLVDLLDEDPEQVAGTIAALSAHTMRQSKRLIRRILDGQTDDDDDSRALFDAAFTLPDFSEGAAAFVAKRKPQFR